MKNRIKDALIFGVLTGIIAFLLGVLTHLIWKGYGMNSVYGISIGSFVGNFLLRSLFPKLNNDNNNEEVKDPLKELRELRKKKLDKINNLYKSC